MVRRTPSVLAAYCIFVASGAAAVCIDGHPQPQREYQRSYAVVVGQVVAEQETPAPTVLVGWYPGTTYSFQVAEIVRGKIPRNIKLFSENTSGRFPMDVGTSYLVFVNVHRGIFMVDSCGNSGKVSDRQEVLASIRKLAKEQRK